jgi:CubicO group peptidase (beta-lactamase class C family)
MVVIRNSVLVGEWYWQGATPQSAIRTWSLAKSYTSALVGLALDAKRIGSVDDPASRYIPEWRGTGRDGILIRHLLSMTSGLAFDTVADSVTLLTAPDMTAQALALAPTKPAGSTWQYSNQAVQIFEPIVKDATGLAADTFAQKNLWGPLGMTATWAKDETGHPSMYANVLTSCRDHARFGELMLRKGCWGDRRIVSSTWVSNASRPSTKLDNGYGWLWWLNAGAPVLDSVTFQPLLSASYHPYAPPDAFCASGLGGQMIEVIPSLDMVVVRAGFAPQEDPALANDPIAQLDAVADDGKQLFHNGVLERVLAGVLPEGFDAGSGVSQDGGVTTVGGTDAGIADGGTQDAGAPACGPFLSWGTSCATGLICDLSQQCMPPQYSITRDEVADGVTGLVWQQSVPANPCPPDGPGVCTQADAEAYCAGLQVAGDASAWRLPTVTELASLVKTGAGSPAIDQTAFPGTSPLWFWTATPYAGREGSAWVIYFHDGGSGYLDVRSAAHVRCVHP